MHAAPGSIEQSGGCQCLHVRMHIAVASAV
jgi:hypothetical protein